jgi:hypothetical protein
LQPQSRRGGADAKGATVKVSKTTEFIIARRLMGIRDKPTAPASPWQDGFAERLIGSIRRECVDHFVVLGEAHLRRMLKS